MKRAVEVQLAGLVQGVGFRWYARGQAQRLGVAGWVRNLDDGSVEAWIEGEDGGVVAMLRWLAQGPPSARVVAVTVTDCDEILPAGFRQLPSR